jgi:hypothetical protein
MSPSPNNAHSMRESDLELSAYIAENVLGWHKSEDEDPFSFWEDSENHAIAHSSWSVIANPNNHCIAANKLPLNTVQCIEFLFADSKPTFQLHSTETGRRRFWSVWYEFTVG